MKKLIAWILTVFACFTFAACGVFVDSTSGNGGASSDSSNSSSDSSNSSSDSSNSSSESEINTVTVTFKQSGQTDIVKTVEQGATLTDIPTPQAKKGYNVEWNRTDFTNITEDITVTVKETVRVYEVELNSSVGTIPSSKMTITYGESYSLSKLTGDSRYKFVEWTYMGAPIALSGTWDIDEEDCKIQLYATWEVGTGDY